MRYAPRALWLAVPALLAGSLLTSCSSNPEATTTEKTAVVVPAEATAASDSAAVVANSTMAPE
ncbi:hypothetical protein QMK33_06905 [Hymenobacter sp. H14-R3]|uniref:hypothetical protein n=1 Tax=Hymenobacter sp. H14-R3 TaxID=3046308 RepID=UPI0024B8E693|nr:hypothetical protein [Hymenobacter sp. H14-R3]MDJ0364876.1 hypothetical protein [Hymenobacter sp. H14-R3]